jgi:putative MATE family efflux protein
LVYPALPCPARFLSSVVPSLPNPVRAGIRAVGLLLARMGWVDVRRAMRTAELAWPRVVTGMARMSKATVDVAMVGLAVGPAAIAGVGVATPFWTLAFMIGGGIAGATISLVARHYGAGRRAAVDRAVKGSAVLAVAATLPLSVLFWVAPGPLIALVGPGDEAVRLGADYLRVIGWAMPFAALSLVASRALVGAGDARTPMAVRAGGALVNVALNGVLIFGLEMGVRGAAVGSLLSNAGVAVVFMWGFLKGRLPGLGALPLKVTVHGAAPTRQTLRRLVRIGTPLAGANVVRGGGQFPLLAVVGLFGPQVVAAFVIALRVRDFLNTPGWGFGLASSSLAGQALGRRQAGRADAYAHEVLRFAVVVYAIGAAAAFAGARPLAHLFTSEPAVIGLSVGLIRAACVSAVFWGVLSASVGALRAGGDTRWPFYGNLLGLLAFALPLAYVGAVPVGGLPALGTGTLWGALVLEMAVPAAVAYGRFRTGRWRRRAPVRQAAG